MKLPEHVGPACPILQEVLDTDLIFPEKRFTVYFLKLETYFFLHYSTNTHHRPTETSVMCFYFFLPICTIDYLDLLRCARYYRYGLNEKVLTY